MGDAAPVGSERFVALDGLRGAAALIVAIGHYAGGFPAYLAVDFFLVLSGFVLAYRYLHSGRTGFAEFIIARLARLYPLHLLTLLVFAGVFVLRFRELPQYVDGTGYTFALNLLLLQNVGLASAELTWNAPSWSISVEFWVNVLFFAFVSTRTPTWLLLLVSVLCFGLIAIETGALAVSLPNYCDVLNSGIVRGVASFLLGVVAYRVHASARSVGGWKSVRGWRAMSLAAAAALMLVPRPGMEWMDFLAPPIFFATVVLFSARQGTASPWSKRAAYLGEISYSIYLIHYPLVQLMRFAIEIIKHKRWDDGWGQIVVDPFLGLVPYLAAVLLLSHFLYRSFEVPSRKAVRNLLTRTMAVSA